jgi:hypothetical protein
MGMLDAMRRLSADDRSSRYVALAAVLALHAMLFAVMQRIAGLAHRTEAVADRALVWLRLDTPIERAPVPVRDVRSNPPARAPSRAPPQDRSPPAAIPNPSLPPQRIDWRANAARSAEKIVGAGRDETYRSFGPRKTPEHEELAAPSIFRELPKHEYGQVSEIGGRSVVWMNDNCYTELDTVVKSARDLVVTNSSSFASPAINCVGGDAGSFHLVMPNPSSFTPPSLNYTRAIGRREADGTLFDHIRKHEEPPVPKAGTETNELPERLEEAQ